MLKNLKRQAGFSGHAGGVSRDDQHYQVVRDEKGDLRYPVASLKMANVRLRHVHAEAGNANLHTGDV